MVRLWSVIAETAAVISHANVGFVAAAFAVDTTALVLMAFRWRLFLRALKRDANLWETLLAYSAGVCVCNITPARALGGDACRAALIRRPSGSPPVKAIAASVIYDRATDIAGFLLLGLIALPVLSPKSAHWAVVAAIVLAGALGARPLYRRLIRRIDSWNLAAINRDVTAALPGAIGCSLIIWSLDITRILLVTTAFGIRFVPSQAATVSLLRLVSGVVPIPAGIGVVDSALVGGFIWLGLPPTTAAAVAIVERAIVYGWDSVLGAGALLLLGGSRALRKAQPEQPPFGLTSDASA